MRPPRRPGDDRRADPRRDRRAAPPREGKPPRDAKGPPPAKEAGAKPARTRAERPKREGAPDRAPNARATRAARFRAEHPEGAASGETRGERSVSAKRPRAATARPPRDTTARPMRERTPKPPRKPPATEGEGASRAAAPRPPRAGTAPPAPRPAAASRREPQRIAKLLARAGIASRREIERMIAEGRVAIDGTPLDTPATIVASLHGVTVDGVPVSAPAPARLFLFHKPTGFLTTERDPKGRPTIYDRLPRDLPRVMPVGRLDLNTEGLLLLTTDGELKRKLELPSSGIPRIYRARAYGEVTQQQLEALIEGVEIEGVRYGQIDANMERRTGRNVWIEIKITEGKNREVRRVLEYLGLQVSRLIRVAYGPFVLADLAAGGVVEVRQHDLVAFRQTLR